MSLVKMSVRDSKRDYKGFISLLEAVNSEAHIFTGLIIPTPPIQVGRATRSLSYSPGGE